MATRTIASALSLPRWRRTCGSWKRTSRDRSPTSRCWERSKSFRRTRPKYWSRAFPRYSTNTGKARGRRTIRRKTSTWRSSRVSPSWLARSGGRLHTARSRNDQVATDVRLWLKRRLLLLESAIRDLVTTLIDRVESDGQTLIPGYTHLQRGQPVLLGHHLLAHCWALSRDLERIAAVTTRVDRCPLGASAIAGTPHPIDRHRTAELLGFSRPLENAMDAVAAKDHLQETLSVCAICMSTLSRMAEELVLWSCAEFSFVRLDDRHTTSSSIQCRRSATLTAPSW